MSRCAERWARIRGRCSPRGPLLATFAADDAAAAVDGLARRGHAVAAIGTVVAGGGVQDLDGQPVPWPARDEVARLLSP